ncbi:hypothetical protein C7437_10344 [Psychrobacillus insolitus]|uniref:Uncharacterized protein n=1 Tax=Psychrobacillus insolitus TaxID=1461 RepID=A0A2W7N1S8_9BACI|nr:hypothetical protein [Psychrobacillus insolitus]PZX04796.1 hypothetical protein C7437_10344 [Psychrobacillus insolitus]
MHRKKFNWLPALLITLIIQHLLFILFLYMEASVLPEAFQSFFILVVVIAILGGLIGTHFYMKHALHFGGICAALYIVLNRLYYGHDLLNTDAILIVLVAYVAGYIGAILYHKQLGRFL